MAWIQERANHVRVMWREGGRGSTPEYEKFASRTEAEVYKTLVEAAGNRRPTPVVEDGRPPRPIAGLPCTVETWATYWLSGLSGVRGRTAKDYERDLRNHVLPLLGGLELTAVSSTDVGQWVKGLQERGLAPKTIRNQHGLLSVLFQAAVDHEPQAMRPGNPCARTRLPEASGEEMHFLTPAELERLLAALPPHYRPLVTTLALTGLRWGEATGLTARNVDLLGTPGTTAVRQSLQRQADGSLQLGPPKTRTSRRTVTLPAKLVDVLIPVWSGKEGDEMVFTTQRGSLVRHSHFYNRVWRPAVLRAGLVPGLRIHDLRHTHAAWLISAGRPLPSIQRRLGHRSITTTIDRYGHLLPEVDRGDLDALQAAFITGDADAAEVTNAAEAMGATGVTSAADAGRDEKLSA
ncbi:MULTISPECIES: tyrosine-type recombinase/integrase [Frankia]|uniref:Integrase n=1 Tax=Frankia alni (strain DSM 45986 / CECT 9034 / ACN14a) TaxID=326424 RepID=Q0RPW7_FRAAA|nr:MULTISPECIES: site-specific integrase [Frankia]CAJ60412.1 Integrase [Frankia alni ACN14a]